MAFAFTTVVTTAAVLMFIAAGTFVFRGILKEIQETAPEYEVATA